MSRWLQAACLLGAACADAAPTPAPPGPPPNVLLFVLDTARADHFSYDGWNRRTSPAIDALARDGTVYRAAHSVAPWTLPSHMSMFTGLLPGEHGATWAAYDDPAARTVGAIMARRFRYAWPERLLPKRLQELGYATVGISNNPWVSENTGFDAGFDVLYPAWKRLRGLDDVYESMPQALRVSPEYDHGSAGHSLMLFRKHLQDFGLAEPFFVFFNFTDPHYPYLSPDEFAFAFEGDPEAYGRMKDPRRRAQELALLAGAQSADYPALEPFYDGAIRYVDDVIGRVVAWLRAEELYDRTLIVVTSDHGEHLGERGFVSHQLSVEEELLRVPLVIKFPGGRGAGEVVDDPLVSTLDIYQTVLAAAGATGEARRPAKGRGVGPGHARDLARMERFDRSLLVAEYYYSNAYLGVLSRLNPAFDLQQHRAVRRAVYADGWKLLFRGDELERAESLNADATATIDPELVQRVARQLRGYTDGLSGAASLQPTGEAADPAFLRELRELGYVGDEDGR